MLKAAARLLMPNSGLGYDLPEKEWFQFARNHHTPDIAKLEEYEYQLYFACDETQIKHLKHSLIKDGDYQCPAFTQSSFNYWLPEAPFLPPVAMEAMGYGEYIMPNAPPKAKIKGELHAIRPYQFKELDNYKENGVQFQRTRVKLIVPFRRIEFVKDRYNLPDWIDSVAEEGGKSMGLTKESVAIIRAWMYTGVPKFWDKLISAYDYRSVQAYEAKNRTWCKEYYQLRASKP